MQVEVVQLTFKLRGRQKCRSVRNARINATPVVQDCKEKIVIVVIQKKERGRGKENGNGCEGGKRWNLLELSCARGREA